MITDYHAKYFAWELTRQRRGGNVDRIGRSLFDASVDLNPHQIDAALFALQNPLAKGVVLADEVGLGKTIEAALVMAQYWAERRRRLLVVCPASLRKQWASELAEKFHLPARVLDARVWRERRKAGVVDPLAEAFVNVVSYGFVARMQAAMASNPWDLVVFDEAHKLRNAHRDSHRTGQAIKQAFGSCHKLLLTATPLQNSLLEIFGLSTVIDEHLFGDRKSFRDQYMGSASDLDALRDRLAEFIKRSLRKHVNEYVRYTERHAITVPFEPLPDELRLYHLVSAYLQRDDSYGVPHRQRHLVTLVARKLLASSTQAVIGNLEAVLARLRKLEQGQRADDTWLEQLIDGEDFPEDVLDEAIEGEGLDPEPADMPVQKIDHDKVQGEIAELESYIDLARRIADDAKAKALLTALDAGFARMAAMGAERKAVVFTESRRTQDYLFQYLERHGHLGKVVMFNGSNTDAASRAIHQRWLARYTGTDRATGSPAVDRRTALIDAFREDADILIATEAAAEGVNLQFCSLVINYDLPWNPQRVEQRIGRCHRYGQKFDVAVINFLNEKNAADRRVLELLQEKFQLFDGLFGASDEVIGRIESGVAFEQRVAAIYDACRSEVEIQSAFDALQKELEDSIHQRMDETRRKLLEHFDTQIHELLKLHRTEAVAQLGFISRLFWRLTRHQLAGRANFDEEALAFTLSESPLADVPNGCYSLIRKDADTGTEDTHLYRLGHPLGEWVLDTGRRLETPQAEITFDLAGYSAKLTALEQLSPRAGWLELNLLTLDSFQREEHLVFTALADDGSLLDTERVELLFRLDAANCTAIDATPPDKLAATSRRQLDAKLSAVLEENQAYFQRERAKLEAWADDQTISVEKALEDTKVRLKQAQREARQAQSIEAQKQAEESIAGLRKALRRQRERIFEVEDAIEAKRDALIAALEKQIHRQSTTLNLFRIRWRLS